MATNAAWCGGAGEARNAADEAMRGVAGAQAGWWVRRVGRTRGRGRRAYSHAQRDDGRPRREAEITRGMGRGYRRAGMSHDGEKNGRFGRNHFS